MISLATHKEALKPYKQNVFSAGYTLKAAEATILKPHETYSISTGVFLTVTPPDQVFHGLIVPRTRMANLGLLVHPTIIESDFENQIKVIITNLNDETYTIESEDSIAYLVFHRTVNIEGSVEIVKFTT